MVKYNITNISVQLRREGKTEDYCQMYIRRILNMVDVEVSDNQSD